MISAADTIVAPASGQGRAAICVVRISGSATRALLERTAGGVPPERRLTLKTLVDPATGESLDQALIAWMPGPHSFTGEDQAELHIHGGLAVRRAVLRALVAAGCRFAEPGEFTRRAFLNGRMDLSSVEGLADLIDAETEAQRRQAFRQLEGRLGEVVESWRERLIGILADLEAALDFSDEGDVAADLEARIAGRLTPLADEIRAHLDDGHRGERLREGFTVVIAGPPNAGKSTLLNALARRDVAIVSEVPGTTRDAIEVRCDLDGLPVTFIDTAGLRVTADPVEQQGVSRTKAHMAKADAVLWLVPPDGEPPPPLSGTSLVVGTKADLANPCSNTDIALSALTGAGLPELLNCVRDLAEGSLGGGDALVTRERHRDALVQAEICLRRAEPMLAAARTELAAEDVRLALRALGEVTGRVGVEEVLDRLFASFCIGK